MNRRTLPVITAFLLAVSLLAACGEDEKKPAQKKPPPKTETAAQKPASASEIESKLEQSLSGSGATTGTTSGPKVRSVSCPDVKPSKGTSFTCKAKGDQGLAGTIKVTPQSDKGVPFSYKGDLEGSGVTQQVSGTIN